MQPYDPNQQPPEQPWSEQPRPHDDEPGGRGQEPTGTWQQQPYPAGPYNGGADQGGDRPGGAYPGGPYSGGPYSGQPYPGGPGQGQPYPQQGPPQQQGPSYQGPPHQGPPHQGPPHQGPGYPPQGFPQQGHPRQGPQQGYPQQGWGGPPPSAPRKRSAKALYLGLAALVVVAALVVGGIFLFSGSSSSGAKPQATVTGYLAALAAGNADKALSYGPPPASKLLLTDAVLEAQQKQAAISAVRVVGEQTAGNSAQVHVNYNFGNQHADETYNLTKSGGAWKLSATVITIDLSYESGGDLPPLSVNGVAVDGQQKVYAFPGPITYGSTNANFAVSTGSGASGFPLSPNDYYSTPVLQGALSSTGQQTVQQAVQSAMKTCAASKASMPANCPQDGDDIANSAAPGGEVVDNSCSWTAPTDYSQLMYNPGSPLTSVDVYGNANFSGTCTLQYYSFKSNKNINKQASGTSNAYISGTVDLSRNPAVFIPNS